MEYTQLGRSGLTVSRICLGSLSFGECRPGGHRWLLDPAASERIVAHALDLGVTFFDTANKYADGTSELYLGQALRHCAPRDRYVLATKVYFNEGALSRRAILRECDTSLKRLGTDYIDLYIIHRFDYTTPIEETMEALHDLVLSGKVRALGASSMLAYQFLSMQHAAQLHGWTPFVSMQDHYNLLYREEEREMLPLCRETGIAVTPFSPLASGRLCRPADAAPTLRLQTDRVASGKYDATQAADAVITGHVQTVAESRGVSMTQVALAWLFARGAASVVTGATKAVHLDEAAAAVSLRLTEEEIALLERDYIPHEMNCIKRS